MSSNTYGILELTHSIYFFLYVENPMQWNSDQEQDYLTV